MSTISKRFAGKSVLIVGSASGLGAATARAFAAEGARLTLVDIDAAALSVIASELSDAGAQTIAVAGNATSAAVAAEAVRKGEEAYGRIDILVNNVGIDPLSATTVVATSEEQWDAIMAVNVKSAFLFSRAAIVSMARNGGGSIVCTASIAALKAGAGEAAYNVSKAALVQLAKSIAIDHAADGIRCNAICPGYLEAVMVDRRAEMTADMLRERSENAARSVPLGREARYDEVAGIILTLSDDAVSGYLTGTALNIDGGLLLV